MIAIADNRDRIHAGNVVAHNDDALASDGSSDPTTAYTAACDETHFLGWRHAWREAEFDPDSGDPNLCPQCVALKGETARRMKKIRQLRDEGKPTNTWEQLNQDRWWTPASGEWVEISDMTPSHARNTARLLIRRAPAMSNRIMFSMPAPPQSMGEMAQLSIEGEIAREVDQICSDPTGYVESSPLVKALLARADSLEPSAPELMTASW